MTWPEWWEWLIARKNISATARVMQTENFRFMCCFCFVIQRETVHVCSKSDHVRSASFRWRCSSYIHSNTSWKSTEQRGRSLVPKFRYHRPGLPVTASSLTSPIWWRASKIFALVLNSLNPETEIGQCLNNGWDSIPCSGWRWISCRSWVAISRTVSIAHRVNLLLLGLSAQQPDSSLFARLRWKRLLLLAWINSSCPLSALMLRVRHLIFDQFVTLSTFLTYSDFRIFDMSSKNYNFLRWLGHLPREENISVWEAGETAVSGGKRFTTSTNG